jgi:cysteine desulfurase/selenocysteine lyase
MIDVNSIREDFPVLKQKMRGNPLVYLDNSATSLKPKQVIEAEMYYYQEIGASIHRGIYYLSDKATEEYENTRKIVAKFINSPKVKQIIYTKGTTESINLVAYSWGRKYIHEGDEILLTEMEHHSNLVPWQILSQERNAKLKFIPINKEEGTLILDDIDNIITDKTKLVAVSGMSNVTGIINPIKTIIDAAHKKGAIVLIDGAQFVSHHKVDVQKLDADFLSFSAHKMCGPTGVGILYGKEHILEDMPPFMSGGDMILSVSKDKSTYAELPNKFEAGTPHISGIIGFSKAIEYLESVGLENIQQYEQELIKYAIEKSKDIKDMIIYGTKDHNKKGGILSFNIGDVHPHDTGSILDNQGIAIRAGHHCCQPFMKLLGVPGTSRASFYFYNTFEEIDKLIHSLNKVKEVFIGI